MKKYIIGCLVGFVLAFTLSAHAEVLSVINKVVDGAFAVTVDGKAVDSPAITIEGTAYLPVRAIGDATGYDIAFDADLGITLTKKTVISDTYAQATPQPIVAPTPTPTPVDPVKLAFENAKQYSLDSQALQIKTQNQVKYVVIEGEPYVDLSPTFAKTAIWDGKVLKIDFNGLNVTATENDKYFKGTNAFINFGTFYIKLSALGLKATIVGDTLNIEKQ